MWTSFRSLRYLELCDSMLIINMKSYDSSEIKYLSFSSVVTGGKRKEINSSRTKGKRIDNRTVGTLADGQLTKVEKQDIFLENIVQIIDQSEEYLSLEKYNLVFFAVHEVNHYYLICFDLNNLSVVIVENVSDKSETCALKDGKSAPLVEKTDGSIVAIIKTEPKTPCKYISLHCQKRPK
ncbi:hypothetical protein QVD17_24984 [Tagetes erecta]|uniref:Uncharacterized protein n=1 Tax=Tagetes erecta TaxID=13708 RepID=A0AAD8KFM3_TARER|nr:hypothetical protein QVD17_24984 [Tagetes erecta]